MSFLKGTLRFESVRLFSLPGPSVRQLKQSTQWNLKARQSWCRVGLIRWDHEHLVSIFGEDANGHRLREPIDDPVLLHADLAILAPFGDIVALEVDPAFG